jgi:hypothetical protein
MPRIADYEKSIDAGAIADGCSCDPYNPLLGLQRGRIYEMVYLGTPGSI